MPRDLLPLRPDARPTRPAGPDPAVAALPLLRRLAAALARPPAAPPARAGEPPLFFFHHPTPPARPARPPEPPDVADLLDDALTLVAGSADVRRAARAVPDLADRLARHADTSSRCRALAEALAVADDLAVTVLHPDAGLGWRVRLDGVGDLYQLHVLLADAVTGRGPNRLPGRPPGRLVDVYRDADAGPEDVGAARFQLFRPSAVRPDGTLPAGLAGVDHWLWGHERPADLPAVAGERVLLVADAPYPRAWPAGRRCPTVRGELRVDRPLAAGAVGEWLAVILGRVPVPAARRAA
jgi:hypothetical protein